LRYPIRGARAYPLRIDSLIQQAAKVIGASAA
jgi:hypothetical protein